MRKNSFLVIASVGALATAGLVSFSLLKTNGISIKASDAYQMVLSDKNEVVERDSGYLHEITYKNNTISFIGYESGTSSLGRIKRKTYTDATSVAYDGMVFNKAVINGFKTLKAVFSGDNLYYKLTKYMMEDLDFSDHTNQLTSDEAINAEGYAYFVLYTDSTTGVDLESITLTYECEGDIDAEMVFNKNSSWVWARSASSKANLQDSYMELTNNPTTKNNCYSVGNNTKDKLDPETGNPIIDPETGLPEQEIVHPWVWYRWNGRAFKNSGNLASNHFKLHTTVMGNISQMIGSGVNSFFNYSIWPEFKIDGKSVDSDWQYAFIGNDNYDPLDVKDPASDPYAAYCYSGRFINTYGWVDAENYDFLDPDATYAENDNTKTLRDVYNLHSLPFWNIEYTVYPETDEHDELWLMCDVSVNGYVISSWNMFENNSGHSNYQDGDAIYINSMPFHTVNFGYANGDPANKYQGFFTYPRIELL